MGCDPRAASESACEHIVPLTKAAASALAALATESEFVFSVSNGSKPMDATTLRRHAAK